MTRREFLKFMGLSASGFFHLCSGFGQFKEKSRLSQSSSVPPSLYGMKMEKVFVPMPDGARIAATLYLPDGAPSGEKFPVILEVLPYRKDDDFAERDYAIYSWFARRGYIGCRVDVRGTGGSSGSPEDEYTNQEHRDTIEMIEWLVRHPLCSGNIGMWGISYGGFNSLQVAMLRPPALKAIASIYASDDRYTDDVHYYGGCLQAFENIWVVGMEAENAFPPYPEYSPLDARTLERFETEPWMFRWLRHQVNDSYWRRGSLRPYYESITVPTFLIGGWMDGYVNAVARMMRSLKVPIRAIIGPWPHARPDEDGPWERIHWLYELVRWWDEWLKGNRTGVMAQPPISLFIRESYPPSNFRLAGVKIPGRWKFEDKWPPEGVQERHFFAGPDGMLKEDLLETVDFKLLYRPTVGTTGKTWAPDGDGSYGVDQRSDDAYCLTFTTEELGEPLEVLGVPLAILFVTSPVDRMNWIVRLNDIFPDGTSQFVTRGVLNATHRYSHSRPAPVIPGEMYRLEIPMQVTSWIFAKGHRIRFSISNGEWPVVWPSPFPGTNTVFTGGETPTGLVIPIRRAGKNKVPRFLPPEDVKESGLYRSWEEAPSWVVHRDEGSRSTRLDFQDECGVELPGDQVKFSIKRRMGLSASDSAPDKAFLGGWAVVSAARKKRTLSVRAEVSLRSDAERFHLRVRRMLEENGRVLRKRSWEESIPRNLV